jgi:hypothetical protein
VDFSETLEGVLAFAPDFFAASAPDEDDACLLSIELEPCTMPVEVLLVGAAASSARNARKGDVVRVAALLDGDRASAVDAFTVLGHAT